MLKRNGPSETFYFGFTLADGLIEVAKPAEKQAEEVTLGAPEMLRCAVLVKATFKAG